MKRETKVAARAKINLYLEVTGRREDGYHELETVMQSVSLCDEVTVGYDPAGAGIAVSSNKRYIPGDMTNVAAKCAARFLEETGKAGGVEIFIEKKIPVAAGLGGGSADGAAVLKALNELTGAGLSEERLCAIGAKVGADIPFCIVGGCALATGIGEKFTPLPTVRGMWAVIAIGSRGSSTPAAYKALDEAGYTQKKSVKAMVEAIRRGDCAQIAKETYNAFESVVYEENKDAQRLCALLSEKGARGALLTGSGAAVFGLFEDPKAARTVCDELRGEGFFAVVASFVGKETGGRDGKKLREI